LKIGVMKSLSLPLGLIRFLPLLGRVEAGCCQPAPL